MIYDKTIFEDRIQQKFGNKVKGYAFVIANKDGIKDKVSSGYAHTPEDGNVLMKTYVASCIGSVSKVLSGIALLNLFDKHKLADISVQEQLDISIWNRLPLKWQDSFADGNIEQITYRLLLQHRSGFRITDGEAKNKTKGTKVSYVLSEGVELSDIGEREYNNFNFAILLFLIPAIAYPTSVNKIHDKYKHLDINEYSKKITPEYGELYGKYMHEEVFATSINTINPTCKPVDELEENEYARYYSSASSKNGDVINSDYCRSQGGWYITAQDLAIFARTFAFTNRYIGPTTRASLYNPETEDTRDERLVYNRLVTDSRFEREAESIRPYHGGTQKKYRAALISLPYDCYGVGMTNSPNDGGSGGLAKAILNSFYDATHGVYSIKKYLNSKGIPLPASMTENVFNSATGTYSLLSLFGIKI